MTSVKPHVKSLKILMVAPQPYFSPRGTPFSVLHRVRALCALGHTVDLVTYPIGEDVVVPGLNIYRSANLARSKTIKIGPSVAKLLLDIPLYLTTRKLIKKNKYDILHSHEEAAFFCAGLSKKARIPHLYDMHSSLPQQLGNFNRFNFKFIKGTFHFLENYILKTCSGVITICDELAVITQHVCPDTPQKNIENIGDDRQVFPVSEGLVDGHVDFSNKQMVLYTGTLETYQGIDLLIESFAKLQQMLPKVKMVVVGGTETQVRAFEEMAISLDVSDNIHFIGTVHPSKLGNFYNQASIIVSPRSLGTNTPLKLYSYLRSGVPIVATDRLTHTQLLNKEICHLAPADSESFASGMFKVLSDEVYANTLTKNALNFAKEHFSDDLYIEMVGDLYDQVFSGALTKAKLINNGE